MSLIIREATPDDAPVIAEFNSLMSSETEGRPLDKSLVLAGVRNLIGDSQKGHYFVADVAGQVVGQLMLTFEWSDWRNGVQWWIQSVYIHEDFRRQWVFSALYGHVESLARNDSSVCGIRLYVEENNARTRETYRNLGMSEPGFLVMEVDFREQ